MSQLTTNDIHTGAARNDLPVPAFDPSRIMGPSFTEALLDPGSVFRDPIEVVEHPWFTHEEKRTVLLSWARDELVLEQVANRALPELRPKSRIDSVIEALSHFDASAAAEFCTAVAGIRAHHLRRSASAGPVDRAMKIKAMRREASCRNSYSG